jgi:hypothetical protein
MINSKYYYIRVYPVTKLCIFRRRPLKYEKISFPNIKRRVTKLNTGKDNNYKCICVTEQGLLYTNKRNIPFHLSQTVQGILDMLELQGVVQMYVSYSSP